MKKTSKRPSQKPDSSAALQQLQQQLLQLRQQLDQDMQKRWQRSLSFDELLSDRWQRAQQLRFGKAASIYSSSLVYGKVKVGAHSWIGPYTLLDGSGGSIVIGTYCNISAGVQIYTHDTIHWCLSAGRSKPRQAPVRIGNSTYIGPQTLIQQGVKIGDHCVIGANSVVNRSIPPYSFAVGSPCKVIGKVKRDAKGKYHFSVDPE